MSIYEQPKCSGVEDFSPLETACVAVTTGTTSAASYFSGANDVAADPSSWWMGSLENMNRMRSHRDLTGRHFGPHGLFAGTGASIGVSSSVRASSAANAVAATVTVYAQLSCFVQTPEPPVVETQCPLYSATNTNSDAENYATCFIYACPGASLVADGCNEACAGDQILSLYSAAGKQLVFNDDGSSAQCGLCSLIEYETTEACQIYSLHEGCYGDESCAGHVEVSGGTVVVSAAPTPSPTKPATFNCLPYETSDTNNDLQNYETCTLFACPGASVLLSGCNAECEGDQYLRLFDSNETQVDYNDDGCGSGSYSLCAQIAYVTSGPCQNYFLHEGCADSETCGGTIVVTGGQPVVPFIPTPAPTAAPTNAEPFNCTSYIGIDTESDTQNYGTCAVYACPGAKLTFNGCNNACYGSQYLRLFNSDSTELETTDVGCGSGAYASCAQIEYAAVEACQIYYLHEGCVGTSSCEGMITVTGGQFPYDTTTSATAAPDLPDEEAKKSGPDVGEKGSDRVLIGNAAQKFAEDHFHSKVDRFGGLAWGGFGWGLASASATVLLLIVVLSLTVIVRTIARADEITADAGGGCGSKSSRSSSSMV